MELWWVSFTIIGFVEPKALFLVPTEAVKSNPRAAETPQQPCPWAPSAAPTPARLIPAWFPDICFSVSGAFLLGCKFSLAFKKIFVTF